jgi:predicted permease
VLTEAMLLALLGGGLGLLLGYWGRNLIPRLFEDSWSPRSIEPQMDWTVFFFAVAATVLTGILCGVAPAWRSTRGDVNAGLKESGQMSTGRSKATLGKFLVVFQVSLSLLLVVGAGLFLRTLINLRTMSYGLNPERILLFALDPPKSQYSTEQRAALFQRISERVGALPGVQSGTLSGEALLANNMDDNCYEPIPKPAGLPVQEHVFVNTIGPRFFETFAIPIIAGRSVNAHDTQNAPLVAVINQRMAKEIFPGANPVGRTLTECGAAAGTPRIEIVGVSADAKYSSIRQDVPATLYLPYLQSHDEDAGAMTFELKTAASMGSIVAEVRRAVRSIDKDLPLLDVRSQTQQIDATLTQERVFATLTTTFGILALILASIGIYGIMAYTVSQRTNEIGIRMALGARAGQVLSMVLRETSLLACAGVVAGIVAAFGLTRLVASMLYGLKPNDPLTYGAAALLLLGVALTAGFMPARGAARIDPMQALRHE